MTPHANARIASLIAVVLALIGVSLTAMPASAASATSQTSTIDLDSLTYDRLHVGSCQDGGTPAYYEKFTFQTSGIGVDTYTISVNASTPVVATLYEGTFDPLSPSLGCLEVPLSISGVGQLITSLTTTVLDSDRTWVVVVSSDTPPPAGTDVSVNFSTLLSTVTEVLPATVTVDPATAPNGTVAMPYSQTFTASGGTSPYTYDVSSGTLPPGLSFTDGTLSGTPTTAGTYSFTIRAQDSMLAYGTRAYTVVIGAAGVALTPSVLTAGTAGTAYSQAFSVTGGSGPYLFEVTSGTLPQGLTVSPTGVLTGTPTEAGTFDFVLTATDSTPVTPVVAPFPLTLEVAVPDIAINPDTLPDGEVGLVYDQDLSGSGGVTGYDFSVTDGTLPTGLALSPAGRLSGSPTTAGSFTFTVTVTDSTTGTGPATATLTYTMVIAPPACLAHNEVLTAGQSWSSQSSPLEGLSYEMTMQPDGNVVLIAPDGKPIWQTRTSGHPGARLVMQGDGNLVVYTTLGQPVWSATNTPTGCSQLLVQSDGNVVIYAPDGTPLWWTGEDHLAPQRPAATGTSIMRGRSLRAGQSISAGSTTFVMQLDGNLVKYSPTGVWASGTNKAANEYAFAVLQVGDGHFVMYSREGVPLWMTNVYEGTEVKVQEDGKVIQYQGSRAAWIV
ncbi:MAG: putative Ig domain-containing protein [Actinomycetales bacterium]